MPELNFWSEVEVRSSRNSPRGKGFRGPHWKSSEILARQKKGGQETNAIVEFFNSRNRRPGIVQLLVRVLAECESNIANVCSV